MKLHPVTGNFVLWQEILSCDRKFVLVKGNFFLWLEILSFTMKIKSVTGNFFLWQEISSCDRKFFPMTENFLLWHKVSYPKFLPGTGYVWNISSFWCKIGTKVRDFWLHLKNATKVRDCCSKFRLRVPGFLPRFLAPWPLKSHPVSDIQGVPENLLEFFSFD